ncbi:ATPase involved in chromosome partitioning [Frankia casuarinae]|nr:MULTISPECIES: hypothetical protein [Frankia]TFE26820.1 hypothetical protein E0F15_17235 [Frankia sp. B2]ETA02758.1 ATPase involved in chromosome partitioning [Frankia sp. CcI6]EYT94169.1 ATPase involved in chromosome partitioning [Frankia casuarinae]KDA44361.1 ATPase involved in chromosome partitioning [Frankia sp. BMG5.23]OAA31491.1 ATPase involved in chromosome partitioning [Frankia casuarinae]
MRDLEPWEEIPVRLSLRDRARIPLPGSWRIAVTSLFPYSGTTTLAGVVGLTLAGVRAQPVLAVDLWPGESPGGAPSSPVGAGTEDEDEPRGDPLAIRVGAAGTTTVADVARRQASDSTVTDLPLMISGRPAGSTRDLDVLPVRRGVGGGSDRHGGGGSGDEAAAVVPADDTVAPTGLRSVLGLLAHSYPLVLVDAPAKAPLTPAALQAADLIILVTLATAADLEATLTGLRTLRDAAGGGSARHGGPMIVAAMIAPRRGRPSPRTRAAAARLGRQVDTLIRIPYDARLDPSRHTPVRIPRLRRRTRRAYLQLAAAAVEALFTLAKAEVTAAAGAVDQPGAAAGGAVEAVTTRADSGASGGPRATTEDHPAAQGVSFGDLRSPTAPTRIAGPDRPGGPPPVGKEPR